MICMEAVTGLMRKKPGPQSSESVEDGTMVLGAHQGRDGGENQIRMTRPLMWLLVPAAGIETFAGS